MSYELQLLYLDMDWKLRESASVLPTALEVCRFSMYTARRRDEAKLSVYTKNIMREDDTWYDFN